MAKQAETRFKEKMKKELDKIPLSFHFKTQMKALRGVPDIMMCVNGRCVVLELKVDAPVEPLQTWTLRQWEKAGAYARVVSPLNLPVVLAELRALAATEPASFLSGHRLQRIP